MHFHSGSIDRYYCGKNMGSLEVLPGSHRPDTRNCSPAVIAKAVKDPIPDNGVIPLNVPPGTVTPPGIIHTMQIEDVGKWCIQVPTGLANINEL